ncbi:unnamed protein product [Linum trigynum]|uniref:Uncharacterized protein n=1 Tax=Linum trigynum TaxID=586398 RepID=A0AAV2EYH6_9ROSI
MESIGSSSDHDMALKTEENIKADDVPMEEAKIPEENVEKEIQLHGKESMQSIQPPVKPLQQGGKANQERATTAGTMKALVGALK